MNNELIFRTGFPNEVDKLQRLGTRSYGQFEQMTPPEGWERMRSFLADDSMWTQLVDNSAIFVCEHNHSLVGMAFLVPSGNPTDIYPPEWCYVRMVGVDPSYRGRGIAKRLTAMCIEHARNQGETIIGLHTSELMSDARHIYESLGFAVVKEISPRYGMQYWLYRLDLK